MARCNGRLPACPSACLPACPPACLPACLLAGLPVHHVACVSLYLALADCYLVAELAHVFIAGNLRRAGTLGEQRAEAAHCGRSSACPSRPPEVMYERTHLEKGPPGVAS